MNGFTRALSGLFAVILITSVGTGKVLPRDESEWLEQRLAELNPIDPGEYFDLAEELLALHDDEEMGELGRELLVRAAIWGYRNNNVSIASSACIAISDLAEDPSERQWMWDLAYLIDPSREGEWIRARSMQDGLSVDREAARCLFAIRYHQQPIGEELLSVEAVRDRIFRAGEEVGVAREDLLKLLGREIQRGLDDACRGRLYIAERGNPGRRLACPDHLRGLGMLSNDEDLRVYLRVEMALGGIRVESWSGAASMSKDEPLNLPSVDALAERIGVQSEEAFYRDGRWVRSP